MTMPYRINVWHCSGPHNAELTIDHASHTLCIIPPVSSAAGCEAASSGAASAHFSSL